MSRPLRVLFTNITLATRTGTELYIKEAALGLLRRGHSPVVYSPDLGGGMSESESSGEARGVAADLRAATVPVVDDLSRLGAPPDLIHAHHQPAAMAALAHFPGVPAVFVSHDWTAWHDAPPRFPRILRYLAVDHTNRDRLVLEQGIPEDRVRVLFNWVDLERFQPRETPLPARPKRALLFSNYARHDTHLPMVEEACRRAGLALDIAGSAAGRPAEHPEEILKDYDLVFAKARAALEAMAVGAAVVLCDFRGLGPLVTSADFDGLRAGNFGVRTLQKPLSPDLLLQEIGRYDPQEAAAVSRRVRETAGLEAALDQLLELYEEILEESRRLGPPDPEEDRRERRALAGYLSTWAQWMPWRRGLEEYIRRLEDQVQQDAGRVRSMEERTRHLEEHARHLEEHTRHLEEHTLHQEEHIQLLENEVQKAEAWEAEKARYPVKQFLRAFLKLPGLRSIDRSERRN